MIALIKAEMLKQHRNWFLSRFVYFSLLIWPILQLLTNYFAFKPFNLELAQWPMIANINDLMSFLIIGHLALLCFWSLMQAAWQTGYERETGTLEIIFLSPANKRVLMYGRALAAIVQNAWMFFVFSLALLFLFADFKWEWLWQLPLSLIVLTITSVIWGALLNVIFLFSRQAVFLYDICDEPMQLFAGVNLPVSLFPIWAKAISVIFPLTYVLLAMRALLLEGYWHWGAIAGLLVINTSMVWLTGFLLRKAESFTRKHGNYNLY
jgi:ABC-2 type transport system permease protein